MPEYTLYDTATGVITGIVEVQTIAALASYTPAGTAYVTGAYNPATYEIDTATTTAVAKTVAVADAKATRTAEVEVVTANARAAVVTTAHGDFPASRLNEVTAYLTAALANASYTVTWVFPDDTTIVLDKAKLITVQRALVDQVSGAENDAKTARAAITGAADVAAVDAVVITGGVFFDPIEFLDPDEIPP